MANNQKRKRYPKYKPSGIDGIGDVPEHWEVKRLKFIIRESLKYGANEAAVLDDPELPRYIRITDIDDNGGLREDTFRSLPEEVALPYLLTEGDILLARSGATVGKTFLYQNSWGKAAYAGYLIKASINTEKVEPRFVSYFTASTVYWQWISSMTIQATIQNVSAEKYASLWLSVPKEITEQQAIADFLDCETGRIDELIDTKRRFIKRLQEKRTALISHVVTKGLDPTVKLKLSGIDWLGDVPEHWEVKKLKYFAHYKSGDNITFESISSEGDYPVYGGNGLRGYTDSFTHRGEYVLIGRQGAQCGNIHLVSGEFWASEHAVVATPCSKYNAFWFSYLLIAMNLNQYSETAAQPGLSMDRVSNLKVPSPPFDEQRAIAGFLGQNIDRIDKLTDQIVDAIKKLQEYRSAIISAAVTGKIDVREAI